MSIPVIVVVMGIIFFVCIVNYSFQSTKYRGMPKIQRAKQNRLKSPSAWLTYTLVTGLLILALLFVSYMNMIGGISQFNNLKNQATSQESQSGDGDDTGTK